MPPPPPTPTPPTAGALGLWDAVSVIVGIVVGSSIFQVAPFILSKSGNAGSALLLWAAGGLLSFLGALVYAELATAYPRDGGDYVYLTRAFGRPVGFLFGWAQLAVILTASIGMMAFTFANYAGRFAPVMKEHPAALALAAVLALTGCNVLGVVFGKTVQNVLSAVKVIGLGAVLVIGLLYHNPDASWGPLFPEAGEVNWDNAAVALILILYAYGGWNDAAFVAAEVRDVRRNLTRALFVGIALIMALYVLVNAAYINALGFAGASGSGQVAADVLKLPLGGFGEKAMSLLVMLSALGAVNGIIFAGSRVYSTLGRDHAGFAWMGAWSNDRGAPVAALLVQALFAAALILLVGTAGGADLVGRLAASLGLAAAPAWSGDQGFEYLFACSAPAFWFFFLLTGVSLFVLRHRDPDTERPFRVPLYPLVPLLFCLSCAFWAYRSAGYAHSRGWGSGLLLIGAAPVLAGLPLYALSRLLERRGPSAEPYRPRSETNA